MDEGFSSTSLQWMSVVFLKTCIEYVGEAECMFFHVIALCIDRQQAPIATYCSHQQHGPLFNGLTLSPKQISFPYG